MTKTQKRGKTMDTSKSYLSKVVKEMPDSGIKDFFDIANTMEGALSLGVDTGTCQGGSDCFNQKR